MVVFTCRHLYYDDPFTQLVRNYSGFLFKMIFAVFEENSKESPIMVRCKYCVGRSKAIATPLQEERRGRHRGDGDERGGRGEGNEGGGLTIPLFWA